ncbi:MAG: hypothetical protein A2091_00555 [Desulfuromonadales bacterium GWD2_61_12]|nr:MAG: hypothetical protein A2005_06890 [Desulfuromonadales bacterium GWC2_61_20]OGR34793.1 MAG: hypothetical protein A2091_00555 [Desulfuromonadales bacterium GWD2_61_12]HAD04659.1 restriction endonuclease subunit S [Desulfuromonas sp.]HBT83669.1 restriction endonuclease subunit S [Desulfuromonas sp.]
MNAAILLKHYDRISEAPDAIPRLRRFILDLAVRGKLVEQDSQDEPASELLKRIRAEKAKTGGTPKRQSAKEGEKPGDLAAWREEDFEVPTSWERVRIRQITSDRGQTVPKTDFTYIDVTAINKEQGCLGETSILSTSEAPSRARKIVRQGDVIYSCVRPYLLNIAIIESEIFPQPIASTAFAVLNGFGLTLPRYIWIVLRSPFIVEAVESLMRGQAYPAINDSDFAQLPFPLPPLAEQQRIVAKVDELMTLCDQLEAARNEREARRQRLTAASLQRLNQPADAAALRADARFYLNNLTRLTTRPEQIKQLRQTILNLAVRGCLVPQDPKDEPASELLKRIRAERVIGKNIKTPAEKPSEGLPVGWNAANLSDYALDVCTGPFGSALHQSDYINGGIPLVNPSHMINDRIISDERVSVPLGIAERLSSYRLESGDVVMARRGEVGRAALVEPHQKGWLCGTGSFYLRFSQEINRHYFLLLLRSTQLRSYLAGKAVGTTMVNLNHNILNKARLQIPPLAEQHRIVARVDELMALCDQLEAQLTTTASDSRRLLEAVLRDALTPSEAQVA